MVTYMEPQTVPSYMSVNCTRWTLRMPNFMRTPHAVIFPSGTQISVSRPTHAGRTDSDKIFPLPPKIKIPNLHIVRYTCQFEQYLSHRQNERRAHPSWAPTKDPTMSCGGILQAPTRTASKTSWKLFVRTFSTQLYPNKITNIVIPTYLNC